MDTPNERPTVADMLDAADARRANGPWVAACGGTERPFLDRYRRRLWYMYQPATGRHAYLDMGQDRFLTDEDAWRGLA